MDVVCYGSISPVDFIGTIMRELGQSYDCLNATEATFEYWHRELHLLDLNVIMIKNT